MKEKVKNISKLAFILIIFFYIGDVFKFIFDKIGLPVINFTAADSAYAEVLIEIILLIIVFFLYKKILIKDWEEFCKNLKANIKKTVLLFGILLGVKFGAGIISTIITSILGMDLLVSENQATINLLLGSSPVMMFIGAVILAPIVEESIFRLGIKKVIQNKPLFIIISGFVFGLMHVFPTNLGLVLVLTQSIVYVSTGITLAYMYEKNNNIYFVIIVHVLNNLLGLLATLILI